MPLNISPSITRIKDPVVREALEAIVQQIRANETKQRDNGIQVEAISAAAGASQGYGIVTINGRRYKFEVYLEG